MLVEHLDLKSISHVSYDISKADRSILSWCDLRDVPLALSISMLIIIILQQLEFNQLLSFS